MERPLGLGGNIYSVQVFASPLRDEERRRRRRGKSVGPDDGFCHAGWWRFPVRFYDQPESWDFY